MINFIKSIIISIAFFIIIIFPYKTSSSSLEFHKKISINRDDFVKRSLKSKRTSLNNNFQIIFTCGIDDKKLCDNAQKGFESAGQIITSTISFKNPIIVNASFYDFCKTDNQCSNDNEIVAGGASPAKIITLTDNDGIKRNYPQALVKQLQFERYPDFGPFDISAKFNSEVNYWFEGDNSPIKSDQTDFILIVLHEFIHGLGFVSSWNDFFNFINPQELTPVPSVAIINSGISFNGFIENIFDKYLIFLSSGDSITNITTKINTIVKEKGNFYQSPENFIITFKSSTQYQQSQMMLEIATTPFSLGFLPNNAANNLSNAIILETTLNPFKTGSSLGHVDLKTYANTSDFLMTYIQNSGMTLGDYISISGNYTGGPIGPKLRQVLGTMGYDIKESYFSPFIPSVSLKKVSATTKISNNLDSIIIILPIFLIFNFII
ncbi:hypothetical protein C1645_835036 [Glomus cerebriforme]|uniref:Sequence orphan n=1 Tax=Glomus cerebriforme TaxID=658196 RepID=A0A397SEI0_9GLOM|nr:hypothetical protein C1645_835036 [Glomus cerebriforme]